VVATLTLEFRSLISKNFYLFRLQLIENLSAEYVIADQGYDAEAFVLKLKEQNAEAVSPSRSNHKVQREIDKHLSKERPLIENQRKLGNRAFMILAVNSCFQSRQTDG
jgi:hypothetical protein